MEAEEKAVEAPVAFGEKEAESVVGLHPSTYTKDPSSSREDRQLGKRGVRGFVQGCRLVDAYPQAESRQF